MHGWVRNFIAERNYGFIEGDDRQDYFFHLDDVDGQEPPAPCQEVTFNPTRTAKGLRARSVTPSGRAPRAQQVYLNPDRFIMTREPEIRGYVIVRVVAKNAWAEANDPNQARDNLRLQAESWGANAIVGLTLEKYTKNDGCSNYQYTMHRFYGHAVVAKKVSYTTYPKVIARSQAEMRATGEGSTYHSMGSSSLVRPPLWRFVPSLAWSLCSNNGDHRDGTRPTGRRRDSRRQAREGPGRRRCALTPKPTRGHRSTKSVR
jgi:cold shock CspA family protein